MKVAILSTGRHDRSITWPVHNALRQSLITPMLIALVPRGTDGTDESVSRAAGTMIQDITSQLVAHRAQALLAIGDRTETLAAATAATCLRIPIIHLHGGEITLGAIDNVCRNAISQLASLHCVAHWQAAHVLDQMGIDSERITVTGAPALDRLWRITPVSREGLAQCLGIATLGSPLVLLTYHPTTKSSTPVAEEIAEVMNGVSCALEQEPNATVVMTPPNPDAGHHHITTALMAKANEDPRFILTGRLGIDEYYSLMAWADVMVGNSSSGIIEAPSLDLPVVNVGIRQLSRHRAGACIDVETSSESIAAAMRELLVPPQKRPRPRQVRATDYNADGLAAVRVRQAIERWKP